MKVINEVVGTALTETRGQQTKVRPVNIAEWARWFKFDTFSDRKLESMVEASARFITDVRTEGRKRWLTLLGTSGAGKTYLAKRIFCWAEKQDFPQTTGEISYPATWLHWPSVSKDLLERRFAELESSVTDKVVFVDEIGSSRDNSGFLTDQLCNFLCRRVNRWTVITSNLHLEDIGNIDNRIASRMLRDGSVVVDVDVPDFSLRGV